MGADQDTVTEALPDTPVTDCGADGTEDAVGVTEDEALDATEVPTALVALAVNV